MVAPILKSSLVSAHAHRLLEIKTGTSSLSEEVVLALAVLKSKNDVFTLSNGCAVAHFSVGSTNVVDFFDVMGTVVLVAHGFKLSKASMGNTALVI